jgi:hypothetical protein
LFTPRPAVRECYFVFTEAMLLKLGDDGLVPLIAPAR